MNIAHNVWKAVYEAVRVTTSCWNHIYVHVTPGRVSRARHSVKDNL